jgi:hypothetical protein
MPFVQRTLTLNCIEEVDVIPLIVNARAKRGEREVEKFLVSCLFRHLPDGLT